VGEMMAPPVSRSITMAIRSNVHSSPTNVSTGALEQDLLDL
jgi:hypothetical protein